MIHRFKGVPCTFVSINLAFVVIPTKFLALLLDWYFLNIVWAKSREMEIWGLTMWLHSYQYFSIWQSENSYFCRSLHQRGTWWSDLTQSNTVSGRKSCKSHFSQNTKLMHKKFWMISQNQIWPLCKTYFGPIRILAPAR
jgi:hypothetical protein